MRIQFTARHFKASDRLRTYAEMEVQRLKRYFDGIIDCEIILDREKLLHIAEVNVNVYNTRLTAIEKSDEIHKSIDLAVAKLERRLKRYKQKLRTRDRVGLADVPVPEPE